MPGPIVAGAIVRWKARMLKISAAKRTSASGTKYPERKQSGYELDGEEES